MSKVIRNIISNNLKPLIVELVVLEDYYIDSLGYNLWEHFEKLIINLVRDKYNEPLTNIADGGQDCIRISHNKPVKQYNLDGTYINEYNSINDATRFILKDDLNNDRFEGVRKAIGLCINRNKIHKRSAYNSLWCYSDDVDYINELVSIKFIRSDSFACKIQETINKNNELKRVNKEIFIQKINDNNTPERIEERDIKNKQLKKEYKQSEEGKKNIKAQKERYNIKHREERKQQQIMYRATEEGYIKCLEGKKRYRDKKRSEKMLTCCTTAK